MDLALWFKIAQRLEFKILNETLAFINTHFEAKTIKHRREMFSEIALLIATQPGGWPRVCVRFLELARTSAPALTFRVWCV